MCGIDGCVASGSRINDEIGIGSKIALKPRAQRSRCECDNRPVIGEGTVFRLQKKTTVRSGNTRNGEGRGFFRRLRLYGSGCLCRACGSRLIQIG